MNQGQSWVLGTLNLNGLRAATRKGFRAWLEQAAPDVLCMQEVRMAAADMGAEHQPPPGWSSIQAEAEKKGYSGTAVWSRLPLLASSTGMGLDWSDREGRWSQVETAEATIVSVYVPSGSSGEERQAWKDRWMEWFLPHARDLLASGRPIAICGDVNIAHREMDIHNPKSNARSSGFLPHERAWMGELLALGWVDLYRHLHPQNATWSWWSQRGAARQNDKGWRIDYILCSPSLAEKAEDCWIVGREPAISDHCAVMARFRR